MYMALLEKNTQPGSTRCPGRQQVIVAAARLPIVTKEVTTTGFIACGACPHPTTCYFKGGCEQGNPTG